MSATGRAVLIVGSVLVLLAPPVCLALALEGRARRAGKVPRRFVEAAFWASMAVYAVLVTFMILRTVQAPDGPAWRRFLVAVVGGGPGQVGFLVASAVGLAGSWNLLRKEEAGPGEACGPSQE